MDVQGVSLFTTCSLDVHWISLSPRPTSAVWTCMVYPFPPQVVPTNVQSVSISTFHNQQNGRSGCIPFHSQQYGHAGCIHLHSQQYGHACSVLCRVYAFPPLAVWACRVYPLPTPVVWMCMVCIFLPPAVWMCRVYPFLKCRNVELSCTLLVRHRNEQNCQCRK